MRGSADEGFMFRFLEKRQADAVAEGATRIVRTRVAQ